MATIYLEPIEQNEPLLPLIQLAIENEISRLQLAIKLADKRLMPFEQKYGLSSETFIIEMVAEDLEGGDEEYIDWAGEFKLKERLYRKLKQLQSIAYVSTELSQSNGDKPSDGSTWL